MKTIARIHSPFKEKFSIPRQPGLHNLESVIELCPPYNRSEALKGLEGFSHLWVIFLFHMTMPTDENALSVRPPRLGGNKKQGVFATRSPFRPNNIGLSLVEIKGIEGEKILVSGGDFLDGTPVIDLKPYLQEIESIPNARSGWTDSTSDNRLPVVFDCECNEDLKGKIAAILCLDPRPRYHEDEYKQYGSKIFDVDIHWKVKNKIIRVQNIT